MTRLSPISWNALIKRLRKFGYEGPFPSGKHHIMVKGTKRLILPNPHKDEIGVDLLTRILKQASISRDEWLSY